MIRHHQYSIIHHYHYHHYHHRPPSRRGMSPSVNLQCQVLPVIRPVPVPEAADMVGWQTWLLSKERGWNGMGVMVGVGVKVTGVVRVHQRQPLAQAKLQMPSSFDVVHSFIHSFIHLCRDYFPLHTLVEAGRVTGKQPLAPRRLHMAMTQKLHKPRTGSRCFPGQRRAGTIINSQRCPDLSCSLSWPPSLG